MLNKIITFFFEYLLRFFPNIKDVTKPPIGKAIYTIEINKTSSFFCFPKIGKNAIGSEYVENKKKKHNYIANK